MEGGHDLGAFADGDAAPIGSIGRVRIDGKHLSNPLPATIGFKCNFRRAPNAKLKAARRSNVNPTNETFACDC